MTRRDAWMPPIGARFGRLIVQDPSHRVNGRRKILCLCDCGQSSAVEPQSLKTSNTRSCGCLRREAGVARGRSSRVHGLWNHPLFKIWDGMCRRCHDPENRRYGDYGARGITVWEPWRASPTEFVSWVEVELGPRPAGHTLDRVDNDSGYQPGNLRWASWITQNNNRRPARRTRWSAPEVTSC